MTLTIETEPAVVAELQAQRITDLLVQRADSRRTRCSTSASKRTDPSR